MTNLFSGMSMGGSSSRPAAHSASPSVSDLSRDEVLCLFRTHDDLIELLYQTAVPAVFDIFRSMLKEVCRITDSPEALAACFEDALSKTADWNRLTVREVTRSWAKLSKQLIMLVRKIAKVKALILKKNGLTRDANVNVTLEFSSILHSIVVFSSNALIQDISTLLKSNGSQACLEIILRKHQSVEKAVVHLVRDGLNELLMESDTPVRSSASGTFPTNFAGLSAPDQSADASVSVLRYSVPQIEAAKCPSPKDAEGKQVKFNFSTEGLQDSDDDETVPNDLTAPDDDFPPLPVQKPPPSEEISQSVSLNDESAASSSALPLPPSTASSGLSALAATPSISTSELRAQPLPTQPQQQVPNSASISRDLAKILLKDM